MSRLKRAVLTAPSYTSVNGCMIDSFHKDARTEIQKPKTWSSEITVPSIENTGAASIQPSCCHGDMCPVMSNTKTDAKDMQTERALPGTLQNMQLPPQLQVLVNQCPWHVRYTVLCPSRLEPLARLYFPELSACWQALGCGTHIPACASTYLRSVNGIAVIPPDEDLADTTYGQLAGLPAHNPYHTLSGSEGTGVKPGRADCKPIIHPTVGVVTNCCAGPASSTGLQPPVCQFLDIPLHPWSANLQATCAALRHSLMSEQQYGGNRRAATVIYVISPLDDQKLGATCFVEAVMQLAPLRRAEASGMDTENKPRVVVHLLMPSALQKATRDSIQAAAMAVHNKVNGTSGPADTARV